MNDEIGKLGFGPWIAAPAGRQRCFGVLEGYDLVRPVAIRTKSRFGIAQIDTGLAVDEAKGRIRQNTDFHLLVRQGVVERLISMHG